MILGNKVRLNGRNAVQVDFLLLEAVIKQRSENIF
jgi:hypothetical protein